MYRPSPGTPGLYPHLLRCDEDSLLLSILFNGRDTKEDHEKDKEKSIEKKVD